MQHGNGHIVEMGWSYAGTWIRGVHAFHYRLQEDLPEDDLFFDSKITRYEVDFNCYLLALRRLERAIIMAHKAAGDRNISDDLASALDMFTKKTPYLADIRNANEHFDDYLHQKGRSKDVDSAGMGVLKVEVNGRPYLRQGVAILEGVESMRTDNVSWKIEWLGHVVDLADSTKAADELYRSFLHWYHKLDLANFA
jgi:hypothetical protein